MIEQPKVFIASSGEQLDIAYAVQENLQDYAEVTVWNQGVFQLSRYTLECLFDTLDNFSFAIFIFTPDDIAVIRDDKVLISRDNIVFELGLFLGRHGRDRCFIIRPIGTDELHLPTDFAGLTTANFKATRSDDNLRAALGPACNIIRKQILNLFQNRKNIRNEPPPNDLYTHCVSVLCYRKREPSCEVALVRTTGGRWMLPKGKVSPGETQVEAAHRHARAKAGIVGIVDPVPLVTIKHLKNSTGVDIPMTAFLLQAEGSVPLFQLFRTPQWFNIKEVVSALAEGRKQHYAEEFAKAVNTAIDRLRIK